MRIYDCIIIGAGPGGLQAAIYLGRYNRDVLLIDRGGGRTRHARRIENFLTWESISGRDILERGTAQARRFGVDIRTATVTKVIKKEYFEVRSGAGNFLARHVIAATGIYDRLPGIKNLHRFLGMSFYTCVDCDGYNTSGKRTVVLGDSMDGVRLAIAVKKMYTPFVTLVLEGYSLPPGYEKELEEEDIAVCYGSPETIIGEKVMEALELEDGRRIFCEAVLADYGYTKNDDYLSPLDLARDAEGFYRVGNDFESSLGGLYIVGPLNTGNDQAIISAGEGAAAAMDVNRRLLDL